MLTLITDSGSVLIQDTEYYVRQLASGLDEVIFQISVYDPIYAQLGEEMQILDRGGQAYLVKQVDGGPEVAKVIAQIDLDEWRARLLLDYGSASNTIYNIANAIKPTGWTVIDRTGYTYRRTIEGNLTPLEIIQEACKTFGAYPRWDTQAKTLTLYNQEMPEPVGAFATRELNLREINYKGKSQGFATRLYAYGKDGLSFASINSGRAYVDDYTYSSRTIAAYWKDERYTVKENLLTDARKKLAAMAIPQRSYDCSVVDLRAVDPEKYAALDFTLLSSAVLIDDLKHTQITYQVLEKYDYPYHPEMNRVVLNSAPALITGDITTVADTINDPNSAFNQGIASSIEDAEAAAADYTDRALQTAREYTDNATEWLTSGQGYIVAVQNDDGSWKELLFMDTPSTQTAQKVLRINENGLGFSSHGIAGPYAQAWTLDGRLIIGGTNTVTLAAYDGQEHVLFSVDKSGIAWTLPKSMMTKNGAQYFLGSGATANSGRVIRIDSNGIAFSQNGYNGSYTQAWNINGQLTIGGTSSVQLQAVNGSGDVIFKVNQAGISWDLKQSKMTTDGLLYILGSGATATRGNVIRISSAGIAFSRNGYNGNFAQSWNIDGTLTLGGGADDTYGTLVIKDANNKNGMELYHNGLYATSYTAQGVADGHAELDGSGLKVYAANSNSSVELSPNNLSVTDEDGNSANLTGTELSVAGVMLYDEEGTSVVEAAEVRAGTVKANALEIEGGGTGVGATVKIPGGAELTFENGILTSYTAPVHNPLHGDYEFPLGGDTLYFGEGILYWLDSLDTGDDE